MENIIEFLQTYSIQILLIAIAVLLLIAVLQMSRIANLAKIIMLNTKNQDINLNKIAESTDKTNGIVSEMKVMQGHNADNWGVRPE